MLNNKNLNNQPFISPDKLVSFLSGKNKNISGIHLVDPKVELIAMTSPTLVDVSENFQYDLNKTIESFIEDAGRTCYKSFDKKAEGTDKKFCNMLLNSGHTSVFEHASATFRIICSRSVLAELTRHRLASYSVQSQRFVNYKKNGGGISFIRPSWMSWEDIDSTYETISTEDPTLITPTSIFLNSLFKCNVEYARLLDLGWKPEQAREILPNCTATEIVMTANFREWINVLNQRSDLNPAAYSEIKIIANQIAKILVDVSPTIFKQFKEINNI